MIRKLYNRLFGTADERTLKGFADLVEQINVREKQVESYSFADLQQQTLDFKDRVQAETAAEQQALAAAEQEMTGAGPETFLALQHTWKQAQTALLTAEKLVLDELLVDAFAAVREACKRTLGKRHYDVQLLGGLVLHQGTVAEMRTGEGKTFVAALPLFLNALTGRGAHLVTPNDYLSKVGVQWMGPLYNLLGVSVSVIQNQGGPNDKGSFLFDPEYLTSDDRFQSLRPIERKEAYLAEITYGTNNEFGFDFLRDNMSRSLDSKVQRPLYYAIVDEADNILIDEARTPLIISGVARESSSLYQKFASVVRSVRADQDYTVREKERTVTLTEAGLERVEQILDVDNLYGAENSEMLPYLDNALRAQVLYKKDVDYLVKNKEVVIVDEFTGRMMEGRRFSEGLHQAIEAKEAVTVQRESMTLASITFQNFFRMYHKLAGMTGTAKTEEEELGAIYDLDVVAVPTHKPIIRADHTDVVYRERNSKYRSVVQEIQTMHKEGRPVLVGTVSIESSELISKLLKQAKVPHEVLNAKNHEREAIIIAQAGRRGAVTIATNMAGRGVDILLGGNPEGLAREKLRKQKVDLLTLRQQDWNLTLDFLGRGKDPTTELDEPWVQTLAETFQEVKQEQSEILKLGGLHVVGTERHESRRIDNQLRGRAGRLGDPGSSRFFLSLEDDLLLRFGGERVSNLMTRFKLEEAPIENSIIDRVIENAQVKVEGFYFDSRKNVLQFDEVNNEQRTAIYQQRNRFLSADNVQSIVQNFIHDFILVVVENHFAADDDDDDDEAKDIAEFFPPASALLSPQLWEAMALPGDHLFDQAESEQMLLDAADKVMQSKRDQHEDPALLNQVLRELILNVLDNLWMRHLTDLDRLREGIGLRALAQIKPIVAYQQESYRMYTELQDEVRDQIARNALALQLQIVPAPQRVYEKIQMNRQNGSAAPPVTITRQKVPGRNDPCPCGSGKKFKHCHMRKQGQPVATG